LLHGVYRNQAVCSTLSTKGSERTCKSISRIIGTQSNVGAHSIHHPIVGAGALAVDTELSSILESAGGKDHAWCELDQGLKTPAIHGQILGEIAVNHRADRRVCCVDHWCATFYRDALGR